MTVRRRLVATFLAVASVGVIGAVWGPFLLQDFLLPLSAGVWALLRICVLCVDQKTYWMLGLLVATGFSVFRLSQTASPPEPTLAGDPNLEPGALTHWKGLFSSIRLGSPDDKNLRRELKWILVRIYASKHRLPAGFQVADRFQKREIALPAFVYDALFSAPPEKNRSGFVRLVQWMRGTHSEASRHRKLSEKILGEILTYFEEMMESKDV